MSTNVILAGATGWAGSELARGLAATDDLRLVSAVSRTHAGRRLGEPLGLPHLEAPVYASADEALKHDADVFVEYTKPAIAARNVIAALKAGAHVVIGTSGITDEEFAEIDRVARGEGLGVLACGNFALTVVLLQKFAEAAARVVPHWEIFDFAHAEKPDAPSGTARELAARLAKVREPQHAVPISQTVGPPEARGATMSGSQIHSVRLPGYVIGAEVVFGLPDQRLSLRFDGGTSARPYVDGALLAVRKVSGLTGLHRGLDTVLDL